MWRRRKPPGWPEGVPLPPSVPGRWYRDRDWIGEHTGDLKLRFPDEWIAVVDSKVVAHGPNLGGVERTTEERTGEKEFPVPLVESRPRFYSSCRILPS